MIKKRIICFCVAMVVLLCASCGEKTTTPTWQEQYDLGVRYLSEGNYQEAIIAFTAAIEIDPKQAPAFARRAQAYVFSGENEENLSSAQADFEAALELDETMTDAWLGLADVCIRRGDYDKAKEILEDALEKTGNAQEIADKLKELAGGNITDSAGNLRRKDYFDADGVLQWYHGYTYDQNGHRASVTHYDALGNELGNVDIVYDVNGNELVTYASDSDKGTLIRCECEYNSDGKMIRRTEYSLDGSISHFQKYQYDGSGNMVRVDYYNTEGSLEHYFTMEYDSQGREVKRTYYDENGNMRGYNVFEYNETGKYIRFVYYNNHDQAEREERQIYNEQGKYIGTETYDGNGNLMGTTVIQ